MAFAGMVPGSSLLTVLDPNATTAEKAAAVALDVAGLVGVGAIVKVTRGVKAVTKGVKAGAAGWKSVKKFQHTFLKHGQGAKITRSLTDTARSTGRAQGQWLNNQAAADLLETYGGAIDGPTSIRIPDGLGQVIKPDGSIVAATHATLVPGPNGFVSAYPIP